MNQRQTCASYRIYLNRTVISMSYNTEMIKFMEKRLDEITKEYDEYVSKSNIKMNLMQKEINNLREMVKDK